MKEKILILAVLFLAFCGCSKDNDKADENLNGKVELYLIDSFSKIENTHHQIDESTIVAKELPLVYYSDFLSYDPKEYTFELSDNAIERIKGLKLSVHGVPFAVKANDVLVYTGYFWPSYSSASCNWLIIDPIISDIRSKDGKYRMILELGYANTIDEGLIPDRRNDKRIIDIFTKDKKLK